MSDEPNLFGIAPKAKPKKAPPVEGGAVQRVIGRWVALFTAKMGEKPAITPRDGAAIKRLVLQAGPDVVERRLVAYLDIDDEYIRREGYPLALLPQAWNKLIVAEREASGSRRVQDADATRSYLRGLKGGRG